MKSHLLAFTAVFTIALDFPAFADKKSIDCSKGQSLNAAVQGLSSGDTLTFSGVCKENVVVTVSGISLLGQGQAAISSPSPAGDAALTIRGAQRVALQSFSVQSGNLGIHATGGAGISMQNIVSQNNVQTGILVDGTSSAYLSNVTVQNNGLNGIDAENTSSLIFNGNFLAQSNTVFGINLGTNSSATVNTGTVTAQQNVLGIQVSLASSFFLGGPAAVVKALNNFTIGLTIVSGAHLFSFGGTIVTSGNGLDGIDIASRAGMDLDAATQASSFNNMRDGLHVEQLSNVNLFNNPVFSGFPGNTTLSVFNNAVNGVSLLNNSQLHMFDQAQVQSHDNTGQGIQVDDGSSLLLISSKVQNNHPDIILTFGSRGTLTQNTIGTLSCDATVLLRGDTGKTYPAP
jgi:hypothetical protein